jgi:hypothetical protein
MLRQLLVRRDFPATSHPMKSLEDSVCKVNNDISDGVGLVAGQSQVERGTRRGQYHKGRGTGEQTSVGLCRLAAVLANYRVR